MSMLGTRDEGRGTKPQTVSGFESRLLRILYGILQQSAHRTGDCACHGASGPARGVESRLRRPGSGRSREGLRDIPGSGRRLAA